MTELVTNSRVLSQFFTPIYHGRYLDCLLSVPVFMMASCLARRPAFKSMLSHTYTRCLFIYVVNLSVPIFVTDYCLRFCA